MNKRYFIEISDSPNLFNVISCEENDYDTSVINEGSYATLEAAIIRIESLKKSDKVLIKVLEEYFKGEL